MRAGIIALLTTVLLLASCGIAATGETSDGFDVADAPEEYESEAPPWVRLLNGEIAQEPEFRGWAESPFQDADGRVAEQLAALGFGADQRLIFLNVMSCIPESDFEVAYPWGLLDQSGTLLNDGYTTVDLGWLEASYHQPEQASCGEGWIGIVLAPGAEPTSVVWVDPLEDRRLSWPLGSAINPGDVRPFAEDLAIADFGEEANASNGAFWSVLGIVKVPTEASQTAPPPGTMWWVAEARYCSLLEDDRIVEGLQLAVDGWYVFDPVGREIPLDEAHPKQVPIINGSCGFIWETFAIPVGLEPTSARLRTDTETTIWQRFG
jgi:hypothetical protein